MATPIPFESPEHCPGAYAMHFYCKYRNEDHPWQSSTPIYMVESDGCETRGEAIAQARAAGWIYHRDGTATCPICAKALAEAKRNAAKR